MHILWLQQVVTKSYEKKLLGSLNCLKGTNFPSHSSCMQKSKESILEFWKRFIKVWKEEAALTTETNVVKMVQTFISGLKPEQSLLVEQLISEWPGLDLKGFNEKKCQKRKQQAVFKAKLAMLKCITRKDCSIVILVRQGLQITQKCRDSFHGEEGVKAEEGGGAPPSVRRTCHFNCGEEGHQRNQCPYPPRQNVPYTPQGNVQPAPTAQSQAITSSQNTQEVRYHLQLPQQGQQQYGCPEGTVLAIPVL